MGYSACFTIDVNMFWIFILFCFLSMLSQAVVLNKIFNLLYKQVVFIHVFSLRTIDLTVKTKIIQGNISMKACH